MDSGRLSQGTPETWGNGCIGLATRAGRRRKRAGLRQNFLVLSNNSLGVSDGCVAAYGCHCSLHGLVREGIVLAGPQSPGEGHTLFLNPRLSSVPVILAFLPQGSG